MTIEGFHLRRPKIKVSICSLLTGKKVWPNSPVEIDNASKNGKVVYAFTELELPALVNTGVDLLY